MPTVHLEKSILESLIVQGLSQQAIATQLGVLKSDVRYWNDKYGLKTRWKLAETGPWCDRCQTRDPANFQPGRNNRCRFCHSQIEGEKYRQIRIQMQEYKGGKCQLCDFAVSVALMFHHIDPSEKSPDWGKMRNWQFSEEVKLELDKTVLVCYNCHMQIHYGEPSSEARLKYEALVGFERAQLSYFREDREEKNAYIRTQRARRLEVA